MKTNPTQAAPAYRRGSCGFIIQRLQNALGIASDAEFGLDTESAILRLQRQSHLAQTGTAGPAEFAALGLSWPSAFERAMNVVCAFEGTSFGDCNLTDIDGAGFTWGIAGFTTAHGEVQAVLARFIAARPEALAALPGNLQTRLMNLLSRKSTPAQWKQLLMGSHGRVLPAWQTAIRHWGSFPDLQQIQLSIAREQFWMRALEAAASLGFSGIRVQLFFLDVAVQNGGWRSEHLRIAQQMTDWHSEYPARALAVAARAVAACAAERWRQDVLARKMTIALGHGRVHGRDWNLEHFALSD